MYYDSDDSATLEPKHWTASELRNRIAEGERLLDQILRAAPGPKIDWIRRLLEQDLRDKRQILTNLSDALCCAERPPPRY